jgi:hypothetical protein
MSWFSKEKMYIIAVNLFKPERYSTGTTTNAAG